MRDVLEASVRVFANAVLLFLRAIAVAGFAFAVYNLIAY